MGEIVNLRQVRKAKARAVATHAAAMQRARFGRSKAQVAGEDADRARAGRALDGAHLVEGGAPADPSPILPPSSPEREGR